MDRPYIQSSFVEEFVKNVVENDGYDDVNFNVETRLTHGDNQLFAISGYADGQPMEFTLSLDLRRRKIE